jgi:transposase
MPRSYSNDLRERVAAAAAKRPCREVASLFGVSVASVVKWSQRLRTTGSAAAKRQGGRPGLSPLLPYRDWLLERIKVPGMTVRALTIELRERGIVVDHVSVWRLLKGSGFTFKKNVVRKRAGSTRRRAKA